MTATEVGSAVRDWFAKVTRCTGPILPDGWFGRPYDNLFELRGVQVSGTVVNIILSERASVCVDDAKQIQYDNDDLVFCAFKSVVFRWRNVTNEISEYVYYDGTVRLVAWPRW